MINDTTTKNGFYMVVYFEIRAVRIVVSVMSDYVLCSLFHSFTLIFLLHLTSSSTF